MRGLRLRYLANINPSTPEFEAASDPTEVTFVPLESVWPRAFDVCRTRPKSEVAVGYTRFRDGDVLVPKITPTFEADRSTIARGLLNGFGAGTTELHVVRPGPGVDGRYVSYLMSSHPLLKGGEAEMIGVAGQKRVPDAWLRDLLVPVADLARQGAIADFLDTETDRLDALVMKKRRMSALLQERRWESFLGRVDAACDELVPLRRGLAFLTDGPFGSAFSSDEYSNDGVGVIRLGNIGFAEFRSRDLAHLPSERFSEFQRHEVREGDLLIAGLGDARNHAGRACVAPDLG